MAPGPERLSNEEHEARGTVQPSRSAPRDMFTAQAEPMPAHEMPIMPEWLTASGRVQWAEDIGRACSFRTVKEADSVQFANYCNLQGAIVECWESGAVPSTATLTECRRMAEQFGLNGEKSRVKVAAAAAAAIPSANPFARNGRR